MTLTGHLAEHKGTLRLVGRADGQISSETWQGHSKRCSAQCHGDTERRGSPSHGHPHSLHHSVSQVAAPNHPKWRKMLWGPNLTRYGKSGLTVGRSKDSASGLGSTADVAYEEDPGMASSLLLPSLWNLVKSEESQETAPTWLSLSNVSTHDPRAGEGADTGRGAICSSVWAEMRQVAGITFSLRFNTVIWVRSYSPKGNWVLVRNGEWKLDTFQKLPMTRVEHGKTTGKG